MNVPPRVGDAASPAATQARIGLVLSVVGLVLCCGPVGIAGAVLGIHSTRISKRSGSPIVSDAVTAIALGTFSVVAMIALGFAISHKAGKDNALAQKSTATSVDASTACALVKKAVAEGRFPELGFGTSLDVECTGPLEGGADAKATLRAVKLTKGLDQRLLSACLARTSRWFVLTMAEDGEPCPALTPSTKMRPAYEIDLQESELRRAAEESAQQARVDAFGARIARLRSTLPGIDLATVATLCPPLTKSYVTATTIDLGGDIVDRGEPFWFLTTERARVALDGRRPLKDRSDAVRRSIADGGPYLLAFVSAERSWPRLLSAKNKLGEAAFVGGSFDGTMFLVDASDRPICAAPVSFVSSSSVTAKGSVIVPKDISLLDGIRTDFRRRFESAAAGGAEKMGSGKLRLLGSEAR